MQKVIRWICRLWALLNILTVLALCLLADGRGGSILRTAATLGAVFLCFCAVCVVVLSFIPAKYTGKPAVRVSKENATSARYGPTCMACTASQATKSCVNHGIALCELCSHQHRGYGCTIGTLTFKTVAPANQRGSDAT